MYFIHPGYEGLSDLVFLKRENVVFPLNIHPFLKGNYSQRAAHLELYEKNYGAAE